MGVGLGPDSYAIIEQGRIGQILATKPMERRAIIEEAAGVTKFKTKKRLAEAKLESSQAESCARERHCGGSGKAAWFAEAAGSESAALLRNSRPDAWHRAADAGGQGARTGQRSRTAGARLAELTAAETQHAQAIQEQEAEQDRLKQRIYELDARDCGRTRTC